MNVEDIRRNFKFRIQENEFTVDRNGGKVCEIIGASFICDDIVIFGERNMKYIEAEIDWYKSCSTNINDINYEPTPKAWQMTANKHGEINSNYGKLIYDPLYYSQYENVKNELETNPLSRRATMVYTRPSIWEEYKNNGKNDFICTNAVTYYVRDGVLYSAVQMRSNDAVYGYKNDFEWQWHVLVKLSKDLGYGAGHIYWQVQNLHVYEKHFDLVMKSE